MKYIVKKDIPKKHNGTNTVIKKGTELFFHKRDYTLDYDDPRFEGDTLELENESFVMHCSYTCEAFEEFIEVKE